MIITENLPAINGLYDITRNIKDMEKCVKFYELHDMKARAEGLQRTIKTFKLMRRANRRKGIFSKNEQKSYGRSTNFVELYMQVSNNTPRN